MITSNENFYYEQLEIKRSDRSNPAPKHVSNQTSFSIHPMFLFVCLVCFVTEERPTVLFNSNSSFSARRVRSALLG